MSRSLEPVDDLGRGDLRAIQLIHDCEAIDDDNGRVKPWNPGEFIGLINELNCFAGCKLLAGELQK